MIYETRLDSPLGPLLACASERGLRSLHFMQEDAPSAHDARASDMPILRETRAQLAQYFAGERKAFSIPLDLCGTPFQLAVWRQLLALPYGGTATYRSIAAAVGHPAAIRAAGSAIGRNPIAIIVPCHRVLGSDGGLTGYAWGVARKQRLLQWEGVAHIPRGRAQGAGVQTALCV